MLNKVDVKYLKKIEFDGQVISLVKRPKGFGDTLENFLHTGTIGKIVHKLTGLEKPCNTCQQRKETLNELLPYR
jgi:hypothetical protein